MTCHRGILPDHWRKWHPSNRRLKALWLALPRSGDVALISTGLDPASSRFWSWSAILRTATDRFLYGSFIWFVIDRCLRRFMESCFQRLHYLRFTDPWRTTYCKGCEMQKSHATDLLAECPQICCFVLCNRAERLLISLFYRKRRYGRQCFLDGR